MGTAAATIVVKISGSQVVWASAFHMNKNRKQTQLKGRQHILNGTIKILKEIQSDAKGEILPGLPAGKGTILLPESSQERKKRTKSVDKRLNVV